jgi:hypothetical protein
VKEASRERNARRAAERLGLWLHKSRTKAGGWQIIGATRKPLMFETLEAVEGWLKERGEGK